MGAGEGGEADARVRTLNAGRSDAGGAGAEIDGIEFLGSEGRGEQGTEVSEGGDSSDNAGVIRTKTARCIEWLID